MTMVTTCFLHVCLTKINHAGEKCLEQ